MSDEDKTKTIHIPGQPSRSGDGQDLVEPPTQMLGGTVVGTLTIVDGHGLGETRSIFVGSNQIGRGNESRIQLDFGDKTISRVQHAVIVYDRNDASFMLYDGGKPNPVLVNGERVTDKRRLAECDTIKIGLTLLRLAVART
ncbi:MAG: FHA domain-containing protein [Hyphomicrobiaceae bacterium]